MLCPSWKSQITRCVHAPGSLNPITFSGSHKIGENYIQGGKGCAASSESTRLPLQCGPGSSPGVDAMCGSSLLLVLPFPLRGFSLVTSEGNITKALAIAFCRSFSSLSFAGLSPTFSFPLPFSFCIFQI